LIVKNLDVSGFRNIEKVNLAFSDTFNFISGRNAQGKTNILEAVHFFSLGRSFRTRHTDEVIRFGEESAILRLAGGSDAGVDFRIDIGLERSGRIRVSVNGKRLGGMSEIIGIMPSVIFTPEDIMIASGPPRGRRTYIDYTAAQVSPAFLGDLKSYRKMLKHRNALLRSMADTGCDQGELGEWTEMLAEKGGSLVRGRLEIVRELGERSCALFSEMLPGGEELRLEYVCSYDAAGTGDSDTLRAALERVRDEERRRGYTLAGPHYDDLMIYIGDSELRKYGSQGRKRLVAIILKLAQAATIMKRRAERPVVLLDDIMSELDMETASRIKELLSDQYQSFITSPRARDLEGVPENASLFMVEAGRFAKMQWSDFHNL
jgi:DNA replication and repair protein RecF